MHKFYFNECLLPGYSERDFIQHLATTIIEFNTLAKKNLDVDKAIITEKLPEETTIHGVNLKKAILALPDRETKRLAFNYFIKSPIAEHLPVDNDLEILENEYRFCELDAINLAIIKQHNGFLFTLPVADDLKKDQLAIVGKGDSSFVIDNLYGNPSNTLVIEKCIEKLNLESLSNYDQLKALLGDCVLSPLFEKLFFRATDEVQRSIIDYFQDAKKRNLPTPFYPDTKIIGDVTPSNRRGNTSQEKEVRVYELRVYTPVALRVYFYESDKKVYIAKIGYKADYKEENQAQNRDIKQAYNQLKAMVLMDK